MLTSRIIPCLDVKDGRVVKGVNFVDLVDAGDPVDQARIYNKEGADELCFLDITASSDDRDIIFDVVAKVASEVFIPLTVGGGVRSVADIRKLLIAGADKVCINTAGIERPELLEEASNLCGSQCIVAAMDAKMCDDGRWEVFTHGGRKNSGLDVITWAKKVASLGVGEILLTSMDKDGTKDGFDNILTSAVSQAVPIPVIASGGAGNYKDFSDGVKLGKASALLAASVFHFGDMRINDVKKAMRDDGIEVRL